MIHFIKATEVKFDNSSEEEIKKIKDSFFCHKCNSTDISKLYYVETQDVIEHDKRNHTLKLTDLSYTVYCEDCCPFDFLAFTQAPQYLYDEFLAIVCQKINLLTEAGFTIKEAIESTIGININDYRKKKD